MDIGILTHGAVPSDPTTKFRRVLRNFGFIGILLGGIGLGSKDVGGSLLLLLIGLVLLAPWGVAKWQSLQTRHDDLALAAELGATLKVGQLPPSVETSQLAAHHQQLEPGEICYVDGAPIVLYSFYGDPVLIHQGVVVAFGSPLAWAMTIIGNLMFWSHRRKKVKKAAPRSARSRTGTAVGDRSTLCVARPHRQPGVGAVAL